MLRIMCIEQLMQWLLTPSSLSPSSLPLSSSRNSHENSAFPVVLSVSVHTNVPSLRSHVHHSPFRINMVSTLWKVAGLLEVVKLFICPHCLQALTGSADAPLPIPPIFVHQLVQVRLCCRNKQLQISVTGFTFDQAPCPLGVKWGELFGVFILSLRFGSVISPLFGAWLTGRQIKLGQVHQSS